MTVFLPPPCTLPQSHEVSCLPSGVPLPHPPPEKSRKGFGYHVRQVKARPDGMAVRDLLSDEKIHEGGVKVFESYNTNLAKPWLPPWGQNVFSLAFFSAR